MMARADAILTYALITLSLNQIVYLSSILNDTQTNYVITEENDFGSNLSTEEENLENNATSQLLEEIKTRILKNLHKTEPPKNLAPLPRLQSLNSENHWMHNNSSEINTRNTKTDFMLADVENITINDITFLKIHFNLLEVNDIQSAEMWIYKTQDVREYTITHIFSVNGKERQTSAFPINNQTDEAGWTRFDVSSLITADNFTGLEFQVAEEDSSKLGTKGDNTPFLLIHKMVSGKNISKRSASNCTNERTNNSSPCCLHEFYVNFTDVGYDSWIIHPPGYYANYCKGSCDLTNLSNHRARIMNALCENKPEKVAALGLDECVSCEEIKFNSISIVYLDENGTNFVSHLQGMSVTECGCT